ncbi:unnamed protein product, partial [Nesidiocoris tenuis]
MTLQVWEIRATNEGATATRTLQQPATRASKTKRLETRHRSASSGNCRSRSTTTISSKMGTTRPRRTRNRPPSR